MATFAPGDLPDACFKDTERRHFVKGGEPEEAPAAFRLRPALHPSQSTGIAVVWSEYKENTQTVQSVPLAIKPCSFPLTIGSHLSLERLLFDVSPIQFQSEAERRAVTGQLEVAIGNYGEPGSLDFRIGDIVSGFSTT